MHIGPETSTGSENKEIPRYIIILPVNEDSYGCLELKCILILKAD